RGIGDLLDRTKCRLKDLRPALDIAAKMGEKELAFVRRQIAERLARDASELPLSDLAEIAEVARTAGGEGESAATEAMHKRVRDEVAAILKLPPDNRRTLAIKRLRDALDAAGIDARAALRRGVAPSPPESLSAGARRAYARLKRGETDITVRSRKEADEV